MTYCYINLSNGLDGNGNSSYIDNVILRDRDANTSWMSASDGTLEERRYYCQNWRADVSAIITSGGVMVESAKYSPYGIPFGLPGADTDSDGDCDSTDITNMNNPPGSYDVRYDVDLDGDNDATDKAIAQTYYLGTTLGWDTLSTNPDTGTGNRKGYAGYEYHEAVSLYHIRNRVLHPELGRWTRRDPLGYVDGMNVYEYANVNPVRFTDPTGFNSEECFTEDNIWSGCNYLAVSFILCGIYPYAEITPEECLARAIRRKVKESSCPALDDASPCCDDYKDDDTYMGANAKCFCKCAGNSDWSRVVRGCLRCLYSCGDILPGLAHSACYSYATSEGHNRPELTLAWCYAKCGHPGRWFPGPPSGVEGNIIHSQM